MIKLSTKNNGFTLVELLVTTAILSILASLSIANFIEYREKALNAVALSQAHSAFTALEAVDEGVKNLARIYFLVTKQGNEISGHNSQYIQGLAQQNLVLKTLFPAFKRDSDVVLGFVHTRTVSNILAHHCKSKNGLVAFNLNGVLSLVPKVQAESYFGPDIVAYCAS